MQISPSFPGLVTATFLTSLSALLSSLTCPSHTILLAAHCPQRQACVNLRACDLAMPSPGKLSPDICMAFLHILLRNFTQIYFLSETFSVILIKILTHTQTFCPYPLPALLSDFSHKDLSSIRSGISTSLSFFSSLNSQYLPDTWLIVWH